MRIERLGYRYLCIGSLFNQFLRPFADHIHRALSGRISVRNIRHLLLLVASLFSRSCVHRTINEGNRLAIANLN